jgi:hypothetical protein
VTRVGHGRRFLALQNPQTRKLVPLARIANQRMPRYLPEWWKDGRHGRQMKQQVTYPGQGWRLWLVAVTEGGAWQYDDKDPGQMNEEWEISRRSDDWIQEARRTRR